jgi:hypothetical protein
VSDSQEKDLRHSADYDAECSHPGWVHIGTERYCAACGVDRDDLPPTRVTASGDCTGASDCPSERHVHGCFADTSVIPSAERGTDD